MHFKDELLEKNKEGKKKEMYPTIICYPVFKMLQFRLLENITGGNTNKQKRGCISKTNC